MIVLKVEKIKKMASGKYQVILEDQEKLVTYDDVLLKNSLLTQKEISMDLLKQVRIDTAYYDIYHKCVKRISTRLRSEKEMRQYLEQFSLSEKEENEIISKLKEIHFIDDRAYAKAYFSDRFYLSKDGPYKIKKDLLSHDIEESFIEEAEKNISQEQILEKLTRYLKKKVEQNHKHSNYVLKQKLNQEFYLLGYDPSMIGELLDSLLTENQTLEKAFSSIYQKLSKKYDGEELLRKVKQKLYQKGYSFHEIDEIIQKKVEQ